MKENFGNTFYFLLKRKFVGANELMENLISKFYNCSILKEGEIPRNHDSGQQRAIF
jgi:hypothetical protein